MTNYIAAQTAGQIIRNAYRIYWRHFGILFLIFFIPVAPFAAWAAYSAFDKAPIHQAANLLSTFVEIFSGAAMAVAVSDICLGNQPGVARSWRCVLGSLTGKLLRTYILFLLILFAGLLLLVVPGLIFYSWFMFSLTVVALERLGGWDALRRSKALGKGMHARNLGVFMLLFLIYITYFFVVTMLGASLFGGVVGMLFPENYEEILEEMLNSTKVHIAFSILQAIIISLLGPPIYIGTVLLYFDMRSRKEAYDATMLAEELRR
jgi:hypothetical protein